jgi:hypothetical protein
MTRTLARTGIAAVVLAGATIAGGGLQAQARPMILINSEIVITYYSNAQHSAEVGQRYIGGCSLGYLDWGKTSSYTTSSGFTCQP